MFKPALSFLALFLVSTDALALECATQTSFRSPIHIVASVSDAYRSNAILGTRKTAQFIAQCSEDRGPIDFIPSNTLMTLSCVRKNTKAKIVDEASIHWNSGLLHGEFELRSRNKRLSPEPMEVRVVQTMEGNLAISILVEAQDGARVSFHHDLKDHDARRWNAAWTLSDIGSRNPRIETVQCTLVKF